MRTHCSNNTSTSPILIFDSSASSFTLSSLLTVFFLAGDCVFWWDVCLVTVFHKLVSYRSARLWWYFTSAPTRACSAFFLIEPISFLNRRLSSSSGVDTFEATLARDVLTPSCADRMILLTSSSIPSCVLKYPRTFFGFSLSQKQNWSKVIVSLLDLKNMHLDLENTWELKLNSTIFTHSESKLMLMLWIMIVIWWIFPC